MERLASPPQEQQTFNREQRLYDDTTTWLAEVLEGHMRTPFEYRFDGRELYGRDGSALKPIFSDAISHAEGLGPNLSFELRRRYIEMGEYKDMIEMAKGEMPNTMVVVSDFPPELMNTSSDIGGYNATRKQTMLRVITRQADGNMRMYSQSLDRSDRAGLEAIYHNLGFQPEPGELLGQRMHVNIDESKQEFMVDRLMGVYDKTLSQEYGGNWYAGRQSSGRVNTYDFVMEQHDLINEFVRRTNQYQSIDESLMYDLAAAVKYRFEGRALNDIARVTQSIGSDAVLQELRIAGQHAQSEGRVFSGCGATVQRSNDAPPSSEGELGDAGYGNKSEGKESWSWKKGICRVSDCPTRPGKTKVGPCDVCVSCQHLFDKGKNPAKEYTLRKAKAKYN